MRQLACSILMAACIAVVVACTAGAAATPQPARQEQAPASAPSTGIAAAQAASHVGERTTVCGDVVDSRYAPSSKGSPTFLNFEKPYPNHIFTVVIWGSERSRFPSNPESHYRNKNVCATGLIETYSGKPQIIARDPSQLQIR